MGNIATNNTMVRATLWIFTVVVACLLSCDPDRESQTEQSNIDVVVIRDTTFVTDTTFVNDTLFVTTNIIVIDTAFVTIHDTIRKPIVVGVDPDTITIPGESFAVRVGDHTSIYCANLRAGIYHGFLMQPLDSTHIEPWLWGDLPELRPSRWGPTRAPGLLRMKLMAGAAFPDSGIYGIKIRLVYPYGQ